MRISWETDSEVWPVSDWGQAGPEQWSASAVGTWWWHPPPRDPATCGKCSRTQRSRPQQTSSERSASYSNQESAVGEAAINDCYLFASTGNAFLSQKWNELQLINFMFSERHHQFSAYLSKEVDFQTKSTWKLWGISTGAPTLLRNSMAISSP